MDDITAPVVVTGAAGAVGRALTARLEAAGVDVRPVGRDGDVAAHAADARAAVLLAGSLRPRPSESYDRANAGTVRAALDALAGGPLERVVFLSYVGADARSPNEYLRAKGEGEEILYAQAPNPVVFRCTHILGDPADPGPTFASMLAARAGGTATILGDGRQLVAPVLRDDVVAAILAALRPDALVGRYDLAGPDAYALEDLARLVNPPGVHLRRLRPAVARALGHVVPSLPPALVDVMLADSVADPARAVRAFGLELHPVTAAFPRHATQPAA